jgi:hypothetical protein
MAKIIKVRCNGPEKHVNEVDVDTMLRPTTVLRGESQSSDFSMPARWVLGCRYCTHKVIVTRQMVKESLQRQGGTGGGS